MYGITKESVVPLKARNDYLGSDSSALKAVRKSIISELDQVYGISQLLEGMALGVIRAANLNQAP